MKSKTNHRLLQLNVAFAQYPWLTWENVQHLGKNNIHYLIHQLSEGLGEQKRKAKEILSVTSKGVLPHSKASKEIRLMKQFATCVVQHRTEVMHALRALAKRSSKRPRLPGFGRIKIPFGAPFFVVPFDSSWQVATNEYYRNFDSTINFSLTLVKELRACRDADYICIWKKVMETVYRGEGNASEVKKIANALFTIALPSKQEITTKRLKDLRFIQENQGTPSDELLRIIAQDEAWLKKHAPQELLDKQADSVPVDEIESMKKN